MDTLIQIPDNLTESEKLVTKIESLSINNNTLVQNPVKLTKNEEKERKCVANIESLNIYKNTHHQIPVKLTFKKKNSCQIN